jgi:hypothetical protein
MVSMKKIYTANGYGGWMMCLEAADKTEAKRIARSHASGASLLPSDIYSVREATDEEIHHYEAMGGTLR